MKKRYCDYCNKVIVIGQSFIRLVKTDYKKRERKSKYSNKIYHHQIYPQKAIGDMCLKCYDNLKENK